VHYRWSAAGRLPRLNVWPRVAPVPGFSARSTTSAGRTTSRARAASSSRRTGRFLFTTNAGDNSVSSFAVSEDGELTLVDTRRTGNATNGGANR